MSSSMVDAISVAWLESQTSMEAGLLRQQLAALRRENNELMTQIDKLKRGVPPGLTDEEWEIIKELRKTCP